MANILLVGEDPGRTAGFKSLLSLDGHRVTPVKDLARWRAAELDVAPEVVVAAIAESAACLPAVEGKPHGFPAPVLLVQHGTDPDDTPFVEDRIIDGCEIDGPKQLVQLTPLAGGFRIVQMAQQPLAIHRAEGLHLHQAG